MPGAERIPVAVNIFYDKLDATSLDVTLTVISGAENLRDIHEKIYINRGKDLLIENAWSDGEAVTVNGIYGISQNNAGIITISAQSILIGIGGRIIPESSKCIIEAKLSPGGLLSKNSTRILNSNGSVEIHELDLEGSYWDIDFGRMYIGKKSEFFEDKILNRSALFSFDCTSAFLELTDVCGLCLGDVHEKLTTHLEIICSVLSLAYRVPVRIYEIRYTFIRENSHPELSLPTLQRFRLLENQERTKGEPLLASWNLAGYKFHKIANATLKSSISSAVSKAILYLSLSRTKYLEEAYFLCFMSLEFIIEEILKSKNIRTSIPSGPWKRIEGSLRACVKLDTDDSLHEYYDEIVIKFPELKRFSFNNKLLKAINVLEVNTEGLWKEMKFEDGLKDATKIRNQLFHSGEVTSFSDMHSNLIRLQFLSERILLKVLGWQQDDVWMWNDFELRNANQI
ncbi:hypothetical protein ThidrDRAFT_4185 [Thiorhodococcus drewsii AZ1]|uniref:ApeA N-terminal domain-containing protein n=2 Tax=Thiorhodococcus drewsii TaxID=210408 RepID=G2E7C2_9GAMM|nr:hypothetical protein ThidrDRAFT_4185 [Thiorhodococcus drewsii AZ1]